MDYVSRSLSRLPILSHSLTILMLTALGAAFLVPLSVHPSGHLTTSRFREVAAESSVRAWTAKRATVTTTVVRTTTTTSTTPTTIPVTNLTTPPALTPVATVPPAPARDTAVAVTSGYGCAAALAYLQAHAAPGFTFECPGWAEGHQAMSCVDVAGVCPGAEVIAISTPCPAAYMNEASNSWVLLGESNASLDPYGYCH